MGAVYQKGICSSFIENYLDLETSLQIEVRKRMSILYTFQGSEFYKNIMMNDYVNKTEKEVILKIIRKNVNKINTYLRLNDDDWEIISDEEFDNLINDYILNKEPK